MYLNSFSRRNNLGYLRKVQVFSYYLLSIIKIFKYVCFDVTVMSNESFLL